MKNKFIVFNVIVFVVFLVLFSIGGSIVNEVSYTFAGNSFLNQVDGENYHFTGLILQVFSAIGILIQLVFVNKELQHE